MGDAIISVVAERLIAILEEQIRNEVKLVRGVEEEVLNLASELNRVRDVLDDADRRGFQDTSIKDWLKRLEDTCYEMDDLLDEWNISLLRTQMEQLDSSEAPPKHKACPFIPFSSCLCFKKVATPRDISIKIRNVIANLDVILEEEKQYKFLKKQGIGPSNRLERVTTSLVEVEEAKGRDNDMDVLIRKLVEKGSSQLGINLTSILGIGGIGKTTLARLIYYDSQVRHCFPLRIWISVSYPYDEVRIAREIVECARGSSPITNQLDLLLKLVIESVSGKKILLVLDDVWTDDDTKWRPLKNSLKHGAMGSSIFVTTRNEKVAIMMGTTEDDIYRLKKLSDDDCWLLLHQIAFHGTNVEKFGEFEKIGMKMVNKCKGLPLAAKVLGSLLRFRNTVEEWEDLLNSELWQLEKRELDLFPHLALSYNDLSPAQKRCFSYCAVFPKDHVIDVDKLIRNWMALGYLNTGGNLESDLELRGREYFDNLAIRSLFGDFKTDYFTRQITKCKMHDVVHYFAQFLRDDLKRSDGGMDAVMLKKTSGCGVCDPLLISRIKEYRSLFFQENGHSLHICDYLTSLRVLSLSGYGLHSVPTEIEKLIHLRDLDLSKNKFSVEDLKSICKMYNLQTLLLSWCELVDIPTEIGNLVQLRHLDLSGNKLLEMLPESICNLHNLQSLNVSYCTSLSELPQGIQNLVYLKVLFNGYTHCLYQNPQGLAQFTRLSRYLNLKIRLAILHEGTVEDARKAEFVKNMHIRTLNIEFVDDQADETEPLCVDILDALRPHTDLQELWISNFKGSELPSWIASPHYQLREISMDLRYCLSLPPFGMLPCLEEITIKGLYSLEFVGRDFLGITTSSSMASSSSSSTSMLIGFPKLKILTLYICPKLKEWEDITAEEEKSATLSVFPCLTSLRVISCRDLLALPHRLLRKASVLEELVVTGSTQLRKCYKEEPFRELISHIPNVKVL